MSEAIHGNSSRKQKFKWGELTLATMWEWIKREVNVTLWDVQWICVITQRSHHWTWTPDSSCKQCSVCKYLSSNTQYQKPLKCQTIKLQWLQLSCLSLRKETMDKLTHILLFSWLQILDTTWFGFSSMHVQIPVQ